MKTRVFIMAMVVAFASFANVQAQKPMKPGHENNRWYRCLRAVCCVQIFPLPLQCASL